MGNVWTIFRRELKSYFASPIAYMLMADFALLLGIVLYNYTVMFIRYGFMAEMQGRSMPMNVNEQIIVPLLMFSATVLLFVVPMVSMRLFSEEKKSGTIELLMTSPVGDWEIVLGKWLGALWLYICVLAAPALNIALLFAFGKPDWKPIVVAFLGLILQGGALLAIGAFISSTTKDQIVAGGVTFHVMLLLWLLKYFTDFKSGWFWEGVNYLSILTHLESFSKGVLDLKDVVFYLSMIFFALFLTSRSIESTRWRA